jgi:hypothetical protein
MDHHLIKEIRARSTLFLTCWNIDCERASVVYTAKAERLEVGEVIRIRVRMRADLEQSKNEKRTGQQPTSIPFPRDERAQTLHDGR